MNTRQYSNYIQLTEEADHTMTTQENNYNMYEKIYEDNNIVILRKCCNSTQS